MSWLFVLFVYFTTMFFTIFVVSVLWTLLTSVYGYFKSKRTSKKKARRIAFEEKEYADHRNAIECKREYVYHMKRIRNATARKAEIEQRVGKGMAPPAPPTCVSEAATQGEDIKSERSFKGSKTKLRSHY